MTLTFGREGHNHSDCKPHTRKRLLSMHLREEDQLAPAGLLIGTWIPGT